MELTDRLTFDDPDREDLYNYVERHGRVKEAEARRALNLDPTAFGHHLTVLRRDGYVRKVDDELQIATKAAEESDEHRVDDTEITVRIADEKDRDSLVSAVETVAREGTYIEAETVAAALDYDGAVIRHNDVMSRLFFVAEVVTSSADSEIVGWVHLDLPEAEKLAHTAQLTIGIVPEHRGKGIGHLLLDRGMRWACEHGYEKLYNSVPATNERAIHFLEDHGWETEAVREDHYHIDDEYVDEVMMAVDPQDVELSET
jgi:ribosomal protein S18 acetylase RimI-like enzyme